jgi:hypothetical protein
MESRIVTAPDLDLDNRFKILLVDVEWSDVERISQAVKNLPSAITVFLYGSNENDDVWCLNAARHSDAILINCRFSGNKEQLKGFLLHYSHAWALGDSVLGKATHRNTTDIYSWLAMNYDTYMKQHEGKHEF